MDAQRAAEWAARNAYGRLIAYLAVRSGDVTAAEDALSDAFLAALKTWPQQGVPDNPEAWLLVTARRRLIDTVRRSQTHSKAIDMLNVSGVESPTEIAETDIFPDERLKLLFSCAHPAIDPSLHTPLMLQTVLGLNAAQIASAFLVAPSTMGQRLVRAKAKLRDAGIPFRIPGADELPERLQTVLAAIYAIYTSGWDEVSGVDPRPRGLAEEALWLARLCTQLTPEEPEAQGLLALMLYCESRRPARRDSDGEYVPLSQQDVGLWSRSLISEAEQQLKQASSQRKLGRFQLEAAIQSLHAERATTGTTNWASLVQLYEGLIQLSPTIGAWLGYGAAIAEAQDAEAGLQVLAGLPEKQVRNYQPYWALQAHLLQRLGRKADQAFERAIGLTEDAAVRKFLIRQRETSSENDETSLKSSSKGLRRSRSGSFSVSISGKLSRGSNNA